MWNFFFFYMWNLNNDTNGLVYKQKQTHRLKKQTYSNQRGKGGLEIRSLELTYTHYYIQDCFPGGSAVKNLPASERDWDLNTGLRRFHGEGNGNSLQYSLGNQMDRGSWRATVPWGHKEFDMP